MPKFEQNSSFCNIRLLTNAPTAAATDPPPGADDLAPTFRINDFRLIETKGPSAFVFTIYLKIKQVVDRSRRHKDMDRKLQRRTKFLPVRASECAHLLNS